MTTVKIATICCFMLALLDEVTLYGIEIQHIRKRCQDYIDSHPEHLDVIANNAWELACTYTEDAPVWHPAATAVLLWEQFIDEMKKQVKLNPDFGKRLMLSLDCSITARKNSKRIALDCIKAINKVMYDNNLRYT